MAKKNKQSAKKKKSQYAGHQIFFIYKNININNIKKFVCIKCNKIFTNLFTLKRHISQIEFKIRNKCLFCGKFYTRVKEHYPHCKTRNNHYFNNYIKNNKNKNNIDNTKYNNTFNLDKITDKYSNDLISTIKNLPINNSFLYFPEFLIGEGTFGAVVFGINTKANIPVAVKVQKSSSDHDYLEMEYNILKSLKDNTAMAKVYYHEKNKEGNLLIESLIGPNLQNLFKFCSYNFDLKTICFIGCDILSCLEQLHECSFVHLDIKPDNIGFKLKDINNKNNEVLCVLMDFGKSCNYLNIKNYIKKENNKYFGGNILFASINILQNGIPNPKDDLESLIYVLLFLYKGYLPWSYFERTNKLEYKKKVLNEKKKLDIIKFCGDDFIEISNIFENVKKLSQNEKPNYSLYKTLLNNTAKKFKNFEENQFKFKWQFEFSKVMEKFFVEKNIVLLNDTIDNLFRGFPQQIAYSYISQYYEK